MTSTALPALRQELRLEADIPLPSGAPGWILFDPLRHLFFQLGALEQRVAALWATGDPAAVRDRLIDEGVGADDAVEAIGAFHDFAVANSLVRDAPVAALAARRDHARRDWWQWLLDHYLFIRIPLVRPAGFLARTLPLARRLWSRGGVVTLAAMALIGLLLVARQWDVFTGSFAGLLTPQGLAAWGAALLFVKFFHELGHAYVATRYGVRVPTMGVSFLVMMPVLYTDTSAAWRLRSKSQRVRIDAAGLAAEFSVAAVALFAWSFLPEGAAKTSAFILATTSLATSLLVNASPFMRFDGYYILSDLLGVPNLAPRAFALARWRLRETLFAPGDPPPEDLPPRLHRALLAYAVVTITYRAILYVGIALLVYHAFFKALGILLFAVEVYVFLARPVLAELSEWRSRGRGLFATRRARWSAGILAALIVAAFLPLDRSVSLPALLTPIEDKPALTGEPAQVEAIFVKNGMTVRTGQPLMTLRSPDLTLAIAQSEVRIAQLEARLARGVADAEDLSDASVMRRDLIAERDRLAGYERRRAALTVRAGTYGRVVDLPVGLRAGSWTDGKQPLLRVVTPGRYDVQALLPETDGWRVMRGTTGRFVPDDAGAASWRVRLSEIGAAGMTDLPPLLDDDGGSTRPDARPARSLIALRLIAEARPVDGFIQPFRGTVVLPAAGESLAARIVRAIGRVWSREGSLA
ncbi:MAG: site-2 protease family protein [Pseudomonadota bacterium]